MRKPLIWIAVLSTCLAASLTGRIRTNDAAADPTQKTLPPEAAKLIFCTETAHAVRDAFVDQLSRDGKCMSGALPAAITAKLCEIATVFSAPTQETSSLVEVGVQPQLACLTCADDKKVRACGQDAAIRFTANFSAEGSYLGAEAAAAIAVELIASAKYMADDTEIADIGVTTGTGATPELNLIKGVISPRMEYRSGTTLNASGEFGSPAMTAAFALNVTETCSFNSLPESFVVPIGLPALACPLEVPPMPRPVIRTAPPGGR